ncbi:MAG: hypothetical protein MJB14_16095 [Spirochaetes bacterium]|nr:hypothetical protein [Spirochaetota bacterium]
MKKILLLSILIFISISPFYGNIKNYQKQNSQPVFHFQVKHFQLSNNTPNLTPFAIDKEKIKEYKQVYLYTGIGLSSAAGTFLIMGIITSALLGANAFAAFTGTEGIIALAVLTGISWAFFLVLIAPAAIAMWVLYYLSVKDDSKKMKKKRRAFAPVITSQPGIAIAWKL